MANAPYYTKTQVDSKIDPLKVDVENLEQNLDTLNQEVYNLQLEVNGIADGTGGKGYATIADAMAVTPLPANGVLFTIDYDNEAERGVYRYDSTTPEGYAFVRPIDAAGVIEEGNTQAVSGGEVYDYVEDKTSRISLYEKMELPDPFRTVILNNILNRNNFDQIWGGANTSGMTVEDNVGTFTATATGGRAESAVVGTSVGDKIYIKIDVNTDSDNVSVYIAGTPQRKTSGLGNWETISFIEYAVASPNSNLFVRDFRTSGWTPIQLKKAVAINLTSAFGAGNEPTVEEMDEILSELPDRWFSSEYIYHDKITTNGMTFVNRDGVMVMEKLEGKPLYGKKIVCFGDSITEFGNYPEQLSQKTGATVYNVGIGGTRLANIGSASLPNYDDLCFVKLTEAIMSGDWSAQDIAIDNLIAQGDDNSQQYNLLKSIDFNNIDIIVFMYGTNDSNSQGTIIGEDNDTETYRNIKGSLNYIYQEWNANYPDLKLYAVTPIFRYRNGSNNSDAEPGTSGLYITEIGTAIIQMAKKYHFPVLDLYNEAGFNYYNGLTYISDGTHPTQKGYDVIADKISKFLISK